MKIFFRIFFFVFCIQLISTKAVGAGEFEEKNTACNKGNANACYDLGDMYYRGKDVAQNKNKAFQLYEKACSAGYSNACYDLGYMYDDGIGVAQDKNKAFQLYEKACSAGYSNACYALGIRYERRDYKKALQFYEKACNASNRQSCYALGETYAGGQNVTRDYKKAVQYYDKACGAGHSGSCDKAERFRDSELRDRQAQWQYERYDENTCVAAALRFQSPAIGTTEGGARAYCQGSSTRKDNRYWSCMLVKANAGETLGSASASCQ